MENKEFRNALLEAIKNELKDFTQIQRDLKKSRKLEFRPKDRSLQSICDEISSNASKITNLIFYYRWIRHGLKYWSNRNIHSIKDYFFNLDKEHYEQYWDMNILYGIHKGKTHGEVKVENTKKFYSELCEKYNIEYNDSFIDYLINKSNV